MKYSEVEKESRRLFDAGDAAGGRELLLRHGYVEELNPRVQELFLERVPPPDPPKAALTGFLRDVQTAGKRQLKAAQALSRAARGDWTEKAGTWLTDPRTVDALLQGYAVADPKSAVEIVGALGAASERYEVNDLRILNALADSFDGAPDSVKLAIAQAVAHFGTKRSWEIVEQALDCKPPKSAHWTVGLAVARFGEDLPTKARPRFVTRLLDACATQRNADALEAMIEALGEIGDGDTIEPLKELRKSVASDVLRDTIDEAIDLCAERAGN